mmetsp:Transcript_2679/g.6170  ORF Transcript_2679/g.6170 Transcript_2679/m.6170 type:complete len:272 (-) Transcript_2679:577-1392(-)
MFIGGVGMTRNGVFIYSISICPSEPAIFVFVFDDLEVVFVCRVLSVAGEGLAEPLRHFVLNLVVEHNCFHLLFRLRDVVERHVMNLMSEVHVLVVESMLVALQRKLNTARNLMHEKMTDHSAPHVIPMSVGDVDAGFFSLLFLLSGCFSKVDNVIHRAFSLVVWRDVLSPVVELYRWKGGDTSFFAQIHVLRAFDSGELHRAGLSLVQDSGRRFPNGHKHLAPRTPFDPEVYKSPFVRLHPLLEPVRFEENRVVRLGEHVRVLYHFLELLH